MHSMRIFIIRFFYVITVFLCFNSIQLYSVWSAPIQISTPASLYPITTVPLVLDSNSQAFVSWLDGSIGITQSISSATLLPQEGVWSTPELIYTNSMPDLFVAYPSLTVDVVGNQTVLFALIDIPGGGIVINASRRASYTTPWLAPISQTIAAFPGASSAAADSLGNIAGLFALTSTGTAPFDVILLQLPSNSSTWLPPLVIAQDNSPQPAVASNNVDGKGVLIWKVNTPSLQLQTMRYNFITQQPETILAVPLPALTNDIVAVDVAVDSLGNAIMAYVVQIGAGTVLYSSTLLAGESTWSDPLLISDPANTMLGFSIASDSVGNTTIFWGEEVSPTQQFIRAGSLPLSGTTVSITDLTDRNALNTLVDSTSHVAMDSFGNAAAIWTTLTGGLSMVQVSSKPAGQDWTTVETLSTDGITPFIALNDQGSSVAVWVDVGTSALMGSRNIDLFALAPPAGFVGALAMSEFLTETAYFVEMRWIPSSAPNILNYEIFENGTLIAVIPGSGPFKLLQPISSDRIQKTYTIIAIASNGNQSSPILMQVE